ncbi:MAG: polysaccharide deacetylase family protein [Alphaproteobacteria bacterium]|nr:polysaccharide deacetylase family protein [Alphaproteobacteria bacterium]
MPNKRSAYLTIDDSPCEHTEALADFLHERQIPALLFVRGAFMEQNPKAIEYAIQKGLVIGNHSYAHKPAGEMEPQEWADDLEKCDHLIDAAYARCDVDRPGKYYRFPYIDRGDGVRVERIFADGDTAEIVENNKTSILQQYLKDQGFTQPFKNMPAGYPSHAVDCLFTYTSGDWMLTDRHKGKWEYKSVEDLKRRIDEDENLQSKGPHVLLMHDQSDIHAEACALIDYFYQQGFEFLDF